MCCCSSQYCVLLWPFGLNCKDGSCKLLALYAVSHSLCLLHVAFLTYCVLPFVWQALKMVLEKESWTIMSAEASQIISLAGLTGDGAALCSPTSRSLKLPINCYHGNSTTANSGNEKLGFASWLKIENPFSFKLENGSAESPKSNMPFDSSVSNNHGNGNNSSFDEENEDLLADFIDEDSQLPSRIPKTKIVKGNSSHWKDGDISSQTGSSLSLLRY